MSELDIDGFLGHTTSSGGSAMLGKWKENTPPLVDTWLHRRSPIVSLWRHSIHLVDTVKDFKTREEKNRTTYMAPVCWEPESVLRVQYKRDDNEQRITPPTVCGICRFIDWIRLEVVAGRLDWLEPIYRLQGEHDEKATVVRAAHVYNGFSGDSDRFSDEQRKQMLDAKVYFKDAWSLSSFAKAFYIFRVVDNAHPEKGVQVSVETALLGDKVKGVIGEMREKYGQDDGNPMKKPYCIRWKYLKDEKEFNKKYKAIAMDNIKLSDEIARLIGETDAPDVSNLTRRFNALTIKTKMQEQCLIDVPWDKLFGDSAYGDKELPGTDFDPAQLSKPVSEVRTAKKTKAPSFDDDEPVAAEEELLACDDCGKDMAATAAKCPHCGKVYEVEQAALPPPPPRRTRSQAKQGPGAPATAPATPRPPQPPAAAAKAIAGRAGAAATPKVVEMPVDDDSIPF